MRPVSLIYTIFFTCSICPRHSNISESRSEMVEVSNGVPKNAHTPTNDLISTDRIINPFLVFSADRHVWDLRVRCQSYVTSIFFPGTGFFWRQWFIRVQWLTISTETWTIRARWLANLGVNVLGFRWWCRGNWCKAIPDLGIRRIDIRTNLNFENARWYGTLYLTPWRCTINRECISFRLETCVSFWCSHADFRSYSERERCRFFRGISASTTVRYSGDSLDETVVTGTASRIATITYRRSFYVLETFLQALEDRFSFGLWFDFFKI